MWRASLAALVGLMMAIPVVAHAWNDRLEDRVLSTPGEDRPVLRRSYGHPLFREEPRPAPAEDKPAPAWPVRAVPIATNGASAGAVPAPAPSVPVPALVPKPAVVPRTSSEPAVSPSVRVADTERWKARASKLEAERDRLSRTIADRESELKAARDRAEELTRKTSRLEAAGEVLRQSAEVQQTNAAMAQASLKAEIERLRRRVPPPVTNHVESVQWKAQASKLAEERDRLGTAVAEREADAKKARDHAAEMDRRAARAEAAQELLRQSAELQQTNAAMAQASLKTEIERLRREAGEAQARYRTEGLVRSGQVLREAITDPFDPALAWSLNDVGLILASEGSVKEAASLYRRALVLVDVSLGRDHAAAGTLLHHLAEACRADGDPKAALDYYRDSVRTLEKAVGAWNPRVAATLNGWASLLRIQQRPDDAEAKYRRAIAIYERNADTVGTDLAVPIHNLGLLLTEMGRGDEARKCLERALAVLDRHPNSDPIRRAAVMRSLSRFHAQAGDPDLAAGYESRAMELVVEAMSAGTAAACSKASSGRALCDRINQ